MVVSRSAGAGFRAPEQSLSDRELLNHIQAEGQFSFFVCEGPSARDHDAEPFDGERLEVIFRAQGFPDLPTKFAVTESNFREYSIAVEVVPQRLQC